MWEIEDVLLHWDIRHESNRFADVNVLQAKRERHSVARPDHVIVHLHNDVRVFVGIKGSETEDDPLLFQVWRVQHDEFSVIGVVGHRQGDEHGVRAVLVDGASCHRRTLDMELSIHDVRGIMVCCHRFYLRRVA